MPYRAPDEEPDLAGGSSESVKRSSSASSRVHRLVARLRDFKIARVVAVVLVVAAGIAWISWKHPLFSRQSAGLVDFSRDIRPILNQNCVSCHGDNGKGNQELGAPDLTDKIWLYGSDEATLVETITNGRAGVMPAWASRLDPSTIKALTVYVHSLGGGK